MPKPEKKIIRQGVNYSVLRLFETLRRHLSFWYFHSCETLIFTDNCQKHYLFFETERNVVRVKCQRYVRRPLNFHSPVVKWRMPRCTGSAIIHVFANVVRWAFVFICHDAHQVKVIFRRRCNCAVLLCHVSPSPML